MNKANKRNRKEEIYFKIKLFETYVALSPNGELLFDPARKVYLDSTEIGAINYWIGMILTPVNDNVPLLLLLWSEIFPGSRYKSI